MYLKMLNESQQQLFLNLAYNLVIVDDDFSGEERKIIRSFEEETGLVVDLANIDMNSERVINKINACSELRQKKIVIYEIIGLALADSDFCLEEKSVVGRAMEIFGIEKSFGEICVERQKQFIEFKKGLDAEVIGV